MSSEAARDPLAHRPKNRQHRCSVLFRVQVLIAVLIDRAANGKAPVHNEQALDAQAGLHRFVTEGLAAAALATCLTLPV